MTYKQPVVAVYPKAFCFELADRKAYQVAIPEGRGCSLGIGPIMADRKSAWKAASQELHVDPYDVYAISKKVEV